MNASFSRKVFVCCNTVFLAAVTMICILPMIHLLAISLSSSSFAEAGAVTFWPRGFTLQAYSFLAGKSEFFTALIITLKRVALGVTLNVMLCVITAFPLSREKEQFHFRTVYVWFLAVTMFFGGGLVPTYLVVSKLGLINSLWALVLPGAVPVWYVVMMVNFFRGIPKALEEAARLDGASSMTTLVRVFLPLSLPSLATILLFTAVNHWNSWFDGFIYMNSLTSYPLSSYLYSLVAQANFMSTASLSPADMQRLSSVGQKTLRMAQILLGALPIMCVYPFVQRYFIKGIVVGSVKE
ncbi:ABC transporter permease [Clostridia bacterium]|nr:ABC transporter permease [Clostridia bacterium]